MRNMIMNMNFLLTLGREEISCKSIHGFQREREQEYFQEGGLNDYVHIRPKPATKPSTLEIERYVAEGYKDYFPEGKRLDDALVLQVGKSQEKDKAPSLKFTFKGCVVTSKEYGTMDAQKGGILVERVTISYQELKVGE